VLLTGYWGVQPVVVWVLALCVLLRVVAGGERGEQCGWRNSLLPVVFIIIGAEGMDEGGRKVRADMRGGG